MRNTINTIEQVFREICAGSFPLEWDENHISFMLMMRLRDTFGNRSIQFNGWSKIVDWKSFKNRGRQETNYGDIALLVTIQFSSGEILRGVACLEAKRDFSSGAFESMDLEQLRRLYMNLPYAHLLMYTHRPEELQLKFPDAGTWHSHMWVSPLNTAVVKLAQLSAAENRRVLRTAFPFSMFLSTRIFWGLDLDFREEVYQDIVEGINRIVDPAFLGVVNVYYDGQDLIPIVLPAIWEEL